MDLRNEIREAIERSGRSQTDVAKEAGVDQGNLSRYLKGKISLSSDKIEQILEELKLELVSRNVKEES